MLDGLPPEWPCAWRPVWLKLAGPLLLVSPPPRRDPRGGGDATRLGVYSVALPVSEWSKAMRELPPKSRGEAKRLVHRFPGLCVLLMLYLFAASACNGNSDSPGSKTSTAPSGTSSSNTVAPGIAGVVSLPLEAGLVSVTSYSFQGSGVQGTNLTYTWDFGDGTRASGPSASHVFQLAGTHQVRVTVANSAGSASATANVAVKSLTGRWRVLFDGGLGSRGNFDIVQNGTQLTGRYFDDIGDTPNAVIEASSLSGRDVQIRTFQQYPNTTRVDRFIGVLNPTVDKVCGSFNVVSSFVMVRNGATVDFSNTCNQ